MAIFLQLAPMQAMTDIVFINAYNSTFGGITSGGFTEMMAPYLLATSKSPIKINRIKKYYSELDSGITMIPQLLSNEAEGFVHYSNQLYDMGFGKVNWNLGCPFPFVTKKMRGSGLLPHPERIDSILDGIMPKIKTTLSIKIRLGLYHPDEILPIIEILNKYPIVETIIHPRTASQLYEGLADKEFFKDIYPKLNMPVIYNGDITKKEQIFEMEKQFTNIKGYMIGRGAFINPFITNQINGIEDTDADKIIKYKELYYTLHNHYKAHTKTNIGFLHRMKELWWYFSQSFHKGESYLFALRTINDIDVFEDTVNNIFTSGKLKV